MRAQHFAALVASGFIGLTMSAAGQPQMSVDASIEAILKVDLEGVGNRDAQNAWGELVQSGPDALLPTLGAMGTGNALSDNWLRLAIDAIDASEKPLDLRELVGFLNDGSNSPVAREMAFALIQKREPEIAANLVPGFLQDSSLALRRMAVDSLLEAAESERANGDELGAVALYGQALGAGRDVDQIDRAAGALETMGETVDLPRLFGFLTQWDVIGPFDNANRAGFDQVFPPETEGRTEATYQGKNGDVTWMPYVSDDRYGMVDVNEPLGALKETVAYAFTTYHSEAARPAELRLGCKNAWKVWLNGEYLFGRDEYHRGMEIDQFRLPITLQEGPNEILVKVCQNEQLETWTVEWQFQMRVCDAIGTAIQQAELEDGE